MKGLAVAAVLGAGAVGLAGCGGSSHVGFYNMRTLNNSVEQTADTQFALEGSSERLTSVACFLSGPQTAVCHATGSEGDQANYTLSINQSGSRWAETSQ